MIVFLVRHAHAVDETATQPDEARHLSGPGRAAARAIGQRLRWHDCTPTAIWTSPLARAVMTAELVAGALEWDGPIECVPALAPGGSARAVLAAIGALDPSGAVVLVGHEPSLSAVRARDGRLWVSRYAWGRDYHRVLRARLVRLGRWLEAECPKRKKRNDNNFTRQLFFTLSLHPAADISMAKKNAMNVTVFGRDMTGSYSKKERIPREPAAFPVKKRSRLGNSDSGISHHCPCVKPPWAPQWHFRSTSPPSLYSCGACRVSLPEMGTPHRRMHRMDVFSDGRPGCR